MRVRGPVDDGAYGGVPTAPLPSSNGHWEWVEDEPPDWQPASLHAYRPRRHRLRWLRRLLTLGVGLVLLGTLSLGGLLLVTPSVRNAQTLAREFDQAHHVAFPGPPVPARFTDSLIATEDHRFYSEPGLDPFGVARVAVNTALRRPDQGGATLYQQLAKMLYTSPASSGLTVQAEELALGIKLDFSYRKAQILQMYSDVAYFGHGYYGLAAASCGYFGIHQAQLSWPQAAMLAGLVQAPSVDDPLTHYATARAREAHVLGRLAAVGTLTQAQATAAYSQPLNLIPGGGHC